MSEITHRDIRLLGGKHELTMHVELRGDASPIAAVAKALRDADPTGRNGLKHCRVVGFVPIYLPDNGPYDLPTFNNNEHALSKDFDEDKVKFFFKKHPEFKVAKE